MILPTMILSPPQSEIRCQKFRGRALQKLTKKLIGAATGRPQLSQS